MKVGLIMFTNFFQSDLDLELDFSDLDILSLELEEEYPQLALSDVPPYVPTIISDDDVLHFGIYLNLSGNHYMDATFILYVDSLVYDMPNVIFSYSTIGTARIHGYDTKRNIDILYDQLEGLKAVYHITNLVPIPYSH